METTGPGSQQLDAPKTRSFEDILQAPDLSGFDRKFCIREP
jgi:hypothetical protein